MYKSIRPDVNSFSRQMNDCCDRESVICTDRKNSKELGDDMSPVLSGYCSGLCRTGNVPSGIRDIWIYSVRDIWATPFGLRMKSARERLQFGTKFKF